MSLTQTHIMEDVLGINSPEFYHRTLKISKNPDRFSYDSSLDYKEDFEVILESICNCGCKTTIYKKEEWTGDGVETDILTQKEWELLPNIPKPTKKDNNLQNEILKYEIQENNAGIIHNTSIPNTCLMIPLPKLVFREPS